MNKGLLRATSACAALALFIAPAEAQRADGQLNNPGGAPAAAPAPSGIITPGAPAPAAPAAPIRTIQHISVTGTQRVEQSTILTYVALREGDNYVPAEVDQALKTLYATGLFSDVRINFEPATATLNIAIVENPIINQVVFEGNSKISNKDLTKEVQIKPRSVFTRAKVQTDVNRIIEVYRRQGKFAATVDPQIIQRPQNRVDLIFSVHEGPTTGISRINFVGNKVFDSDTLKGNIATNESAWWKFFAANDSYDPDRLQFDREQLRRYYVNRGYADFKVVSSVAQLSPDRSGFYITFTVDEGQRYNFGEVTINSRIKELSDKDLRPLIPIEVGEVYNADVVTKVIDTITNAAGTKGYAFAEVRPRVQRDRARKTIDLSFDIVQGPRVYIEKIDIQGNTRTLDKVVRREFRLVEGDAFNRVLIDRSRTRIRSLGFFKDVDVKNTPGTQPDRTDVTVTVTEQSTGSLQLGLGYSSVSNIVGDFSYTEQNLFGRGQFLKAAVTVSQISKEYTLAFTEPYFLDRPLAAGVRLFRAQTNYLQATYQSSMTGLTLSLNFPVSEFSAVGVNYTYEIAEVLPYSNAPLQIRLAAGQTYGSIFGYTYAYNNLDDARKPTNGISAQFGQGFAGFGGNLKFIKTTGTFATYKPWLNSNVVSSLTLNAGYITGYDGAFVPINQRFFEGGDTFRGFKLAGIGPRDIAAPANQGALGGNVFGIATIAAKFPNLVPAAWGVSLGVFTDIGTLGRVDNVIRSCSASTAFSTGVCNKDNLALRASAGLSVSWSSPFGPVQIDFALPYIKAPYDRPQLIRLSTATGL